ncbi:molybdopterin-dependent oxidoreductase [Chitinophaga pinensis]|uniref:Molybdopterin-dependent oxidoreductase n=1 Tax=Chitinophaga pinensis TaxID=79329 RepID=A0A5C6LIJ4_9BACT|nr:molybdopterin-dependent oxidoreductase [Chitinophaga pinensis]
MAVWNGNDKLTLYDATQGVGITSAIAASSSPQTGECAGNSAFVGGGFGSKGLWLHTLLVAMAAKAASRPVKLALTRQMSSQCGASCSDYTTSGNRNRQRWKIECLTSPYRFIQ